MDKYIAIRDCYCQGNFLKKDQTFSVLKGTEIDFKLVRKVEDDEEINKKTNGQKKAKSFK